MHIRKGDIVEVMCGDDRGTRGRVLSVDPKAGKVVVEGVNRVYKHMKRSQRNTQGGRLSREMPIQVANVQLIDPSSNRPTRVGIRYTADGRKELYAKKSGTTIRVISPPRKAYAKKA
jgi:large subunit ribosomal protein L24